MCRSVSSFNVSEFLFLCFFCRRSLKIWLRTQVSTVWSTTTSLAELLLFTLVSSCEMHPWHLLKSKRTGCVSGFSACITNCLQSIFADVTAQSQEITSVLDIYIFLLKVLVQRGLYLKTALHTNVGVKNVTVTVVSVLRLLSLVIYVQLWIFL